MTVTQQTYKCRCGKKLPLLAPHASRKCGCGRTHTADRAGAISIKDKK